MPRLMAQIEIDAILKKVRPIGLEWDPMNSRWKAWAHDNQRVIVHGETAELALENLAIDVKRIAAKHPHLFV